MGPRFKYFLTFFFILLLNLSVYFPAFFQMARADQLVYLTEVADQYEFGELFQNTYSYNRTRHYNQGDELGFRPILFALLAFQKSYFGYNFVLWQLVGFVLHALLLAQLLRLLNFIRWDFLGALLVANFSVLTIASEMVSWHHIHAYILFLVLVLEALLQVARFFHPPTPETTALAVGLHDPVRDEKRLGLALIWLTLACYIQEFGVITCVVLGIFTLYWGKKNKSPTAWRDALIFVVPVASYVIISLADYCLRNIVPRTLGAIDLKFMLMNLPVIMFTYLRGALLPCWTTIYPEERASIDPFSLTVTWQSIQWDNWLHQLNLLLVVLFALGLLSVIVNFFWRRFRPVVQTDVASNHDSRFWSIFSWLCLALAGLYMALVMMGRLTTQEMDYIYLSLYQFYMVGAFLVVAIYAELAAHHPRLFSGRSFLRWGVILFLVVSILVNAVQTYTQNRLRMKLESGALAMVKTLERFVQEHRRETDFSFWMVGAEHDLITGMFEGHSWDGNLWVGSVSNFLFRPYVRTENAKYYLVYSTKEGLVVFRDLTAAEYFLEQLQESTHD